MFNNKIKGWYFKHQVGDYMLSFIPGISKNGAFIQVIDNYGTYYYDFQDLIVKNGTIFYRQLRFF